MAGGTARIPYLSDEEFLAQDREVAEMLLARRRGDLLNLDRLLMYAPPVAKGWSALFAALRASLTIDGRLRELIILRVAVVNRAYYEFSVSSL